MTINELTKARMTEEFADGGKHELSIVDIETSKEVCKLVIEEIVVNENPDFIQFVPKGWEISCVIAIDYTASNKHYLDPESLHYQGEFNQYE